MSESADSVLLDMSLEDEDVEEESFFTQLPITNLLFQLYEPKRIRSIEDIVEEYVSRHKGLYRLGLNVGVLSIGTVFGLLYLLFTVLLIPMMCITMCFDCIIMGGLPSKKEEEDGNSNSTDTC